VDVIDRDVHLHNLQAGHPLQARDDVAPDAGREVDNGDAVLDDEVDVDGGLCLADLDGDALRDVRAAGARDALAHGAEGAGHATAELLDAVDLAGGHGRDLGHDGVGDRGRPLAGR